MYPLLHTLCCRFRFDAFTVDAQTGELHRDGARVPLQDVPLRFLVCLLRHPGELVTREQMRAEVWPAELNLDFESALDTAARKVRQALGDSPRSPIYLETLPGRGYRFLLEVRAEEPPGRSAVGGPAGQAAAVPSEGPAPVVSFRDDRESRAQEERRRPHPFPARDPPWKRIPLALGAVGALAAAGGGVLLWRPWHPGPARNPSVVALPTKVVGPPESAFLTDAIPDTLSTLLVDVPGLNTRLPPTSLQVEKVRGDLGRIAEAYRADNLVLTTVMAEGERLVLNVKVVDVATQNVRWARQFEGSRGAYNELIRQAAAALAEAIRPAAARHAAIEGPAFNSEVELALREGRHFLRLYGSTGQETCFERARAALQRAQSMEPASPLLAAELAGLFNQKDFTTGGDAAAREQARSWISRALELDPRCGLAWAVRTWFETNSLQADPDKVIEYAIKGVAFAPGEPRAHLALGSVSPTMSMQAATGLRTMDLDPLDQVGYAWAALGLIEGGRPEEALPILERALRLEPDAFNKYLRFRALFKLGRMAEAEGVYAPGWASGVMRLMSKGDTAAARRQALQVIAEWRNRKMQPRSMDWANRAGFCAPLLVRLGLREEALWVLEKANEGRAPIGLDLLLRDPDLRQLRKDPRFGTILAGAQAYALRFLKQADLARGRGELPRYLEPSLAELRGLAGHSLPL